MAYKDKANYLEACWDCFNEDPRDMVRELRERRAELITKVVELEEIKEEIGYIDLCLPMMERNLLDQIIKKEEEDTDYSVYLVSNVGERKLQALKAIKDSIRAVLGLALGIAPVKAILDITEEQPQFPRLIIGRISQEKAHALVDRINQQYNGLTLQIRYGIEDKVVRLSIGARSRED